MSFKLLFDEHLPPALVERAQAAGLADLINTVLEVTIDETGEISVYSWALPAAASPANDPDVTATDARPAKR